MATVFIRSLLKHRPYDFEEVVKRTETQWAKLNTTPAKMFNYDSSEATQNVEKIQMPPAYAFLGYRDKNLEKEFDKYLLTRNRHSLIVSYSFITVMALLTGIGAAVSLSF